MKRFSSICLLPLRQTLERNLNPVEPRVSPCCCPQDCTTVLYRVAGGYFGSERYWQRGSREHKLHPIMTSPPSGKDSSVQSCVRASHDINTCNKRKFLLVISISQGLANIYQTTFVFNRSAFTYVCMFWEQNKVCACSFLHMCVCTASLMLFPLINRIGVVNLVCVYSKLLLT